ncbi:hypothetical protein TNCV_4873271 [Trichonephila clavipes]|nr:hypothetical protein TNCV_4873271 [Trichonephila clavipes]
MQKLQYAKVPFSSLDRGLKFQHSSDNPCIILKCVVNPFGTGSANMHSSRTHRMAGWCKYAFQKNALLSLATKTPRPEVQVLTHSPRPWRESHRKSSRPDEV